MFRLCDIGPLIPSVRLSFLSCKAEMTPILTHGLSRGFWSTNVSTTLGTVSGTRTYLMVMMIMLLLLCSSPRRAKYVLYYCVLWKVC